MKTIIIQQVWNDVPPALGNYSAFLNLHRNYLRLQNKIYAIGLLLYQILKKKIPSQLLCYSTSAELCPITYEPMPHHSPTGAPAPAPAKTRPFLQPPAPVKCPNGRGVFAGFSYFY